MLRDLIERLVWTFVAAFGGALLAAPLLGLDVDTLQAAAVAGLGAAVNALTIFARWRLSVLPDPGDGLVRLPHDRDDAPGPDGIAA